MEGTKKKNRLLVSERQVKKHGYDEIVRQAKEEFGADVQVVVQGQPTSRELKHGICRSCGRRGLLRILGHDDNDRPYGTCAGEGADANGQKRARGEACTVRTDRLKERTARTKAFRRGKVRKGKLWVSKRKTKEGV